MKNRYIKPETNVILCKMEHTLLTGSEIAVGEEYNGTQILSRRGNAFWDDEDEY